MKAGFSQILQKIVPFGDLTFALLIFHIFAGCNQTFYPSEKALRRGIPVLPMPVLGIMSESISGDRCDCFIPYGFWRSLALQ
ncbi:hypothetical protein [Desulfonema ishimotonii]|uniref:hypothetical protein n=1 Tax=Desulfonema ishimotonii TaxID=45657 RepID=UPI000F57C1A2|nr:hypothetical protein [Desulfonema ishimotonii]